MSYGKSIELFLVDGTIDNIVTVELSNWSGKSIKIPRTEVIDCTREDFSSTGVYLLFCKDDNDEDSVYIGEAENIKERLVQHIRDYKSGKELYYWHTAVCFIGRDLNKTLIRYLEDRLVKTARDCEKYKVLTKNTYSKTVIKEAQVAMMDEFIDNIKIILGVLGYRVLVSTPKANNQKDLLYLEAKGIKATGIISPNGFTVLKGSQVAANTAPSFDVLKYKSMRDALINDKVIVNNEFVKDYEFSSPSAAASIVRGNSANGNVEWKNTSGVALKDL